jgi:hypothetical protein
MTLEQTDKEAVLDIMKKYRDIHVELMSVEATAKELEKSLNDARERGESLVRTLESQRDLEGAVIRGLVQKYGEGRLDPVSFEWIAEK